MWETVIRSPWKIAFLTEASQFYKLLTVEVTVQSMETCLQRSKGREEAGWYDVAASHVLASHPTQDMLTMIKGLSASYVRIDNTTEQADMSLDSLYRAMGL